jgi:hypothetical protein
MHRLHFLLAISLLFSSHLNGQNGYFDHNSVWKIRSECAVPFPCIETRIYNYYLNSDTVINNSVYYKLFTRIWSVLNWMGAPPPQCQGSYVLNDSLSPIAYVRDTLGKILLYDIQSNSDTLLYDFNLNIGDTLPLSFNNYHTDNTVVAIDSILVSSVYRKRFQIMDVNSNTFYIFEGIGHENGFLEPIPPVINCANELLCYSENDTSYYPSIGLNCELLLGIDNTVEKPEPSYNIYPNPSDGMIHISGNLSDCQLILYNNIFVKVKSLPTMNYIELKQKFGISEGLYFLEIFNLKAKKKYFIKIILKK